MDKSNGVEKTEESLNSGKAGLVHPSVGGENIVLVWLDTAIDEKSVDYVNTMKQFKCIADDVKTFTKDEPCIQFMQNATNSRICLITSDSFGQRILPYIHGMSQVDTILIFSHNKQLYEEWTKKYAKFKGVFSELSSICEALQAAVQQCGQYLIPISIFNEDVAVGPETIFNRIDSSFIHIQVLKEVLSTIDFGELHLEEFVNHCLDLYAENTDELENVHQFHRDYYSKRAIWWYTQESFLYRMLHRALRSLDASTIVRLGFFIDDLSRDIQRLHSEQSENPDSDQKTIILYRGHGLSIGNFDRLSKLRDGYISFNDFLLTSKNRETAFDFVQQTAANPDFVAILFVMTVD
ncbi:unnamed protein product, partial [Adineta ricciae]